VGNAITLAYLILRLQLSLTVAQLGRMKPILTLIAFGSLVSAFHVHALHAVDGPDPLLPPKPLVDGGQQSTPPKSPTINPLTKPLVERIPIPDLSDTETARKEIKDLYKDEYKARRSEEKSAFSQKLLEVSRSENRNPSLQYVLLREAEEIATKNGDLDTAEMSIKELAKYFLVNEAEEYSRIYSAFIANLKNIETGQSLTFSCFGLIETCIAADDYPLAQRLAKEGESLGRKIRDNEVVARARALGNKAKDLEEEFKKLAEYRDLLGDFSAEGHRRKGFFLGVGKNDWSNGVRELALGDDQALQALANLDIAAQVALAQPTHDGTATLAAAEAWFTSAPTQSRGNPRESFQARSLIWYHRSAVVLEGIARMKCDKRIEELNKLLVDSPYRSSVGYPVGAALLLTFEPDTLVVNEGKINGMIDSSSNELRATAKDVKLSRGSYGTAIEFTGKGSIDCGNPKQLQMVDNMTICMWLWAEVLGHRCNPINKSYGGEGTITLEPNGSLRYYYGINGNDGGADGIAYTTADMNVTIVTKKWIHFAMVRNLSEKTITWYRDGKSLGATAPAYPKVVASKQPLLLGIGYIGPFIGKIDDVGLWPRALSEKEIVALYQATAKGR
jgi:hypothetical protein